jgi:hypothetical protein
MEYKRIIGYEKMDNMVTGFILGFLAIGLTYFAQMAYYNVDALGDIGAPIKVNILKLSLLGALLLFLLLNYFDKVFAMKGVLMSVIIVATYVVFKLFWN